MKALHPADHEIKSARVPGGVENSATLVIDDIFTLPTNGEDILFKVLPSPVCPFAALKGSDSYQYVPSVFNVNAHSPAWYSVGVVYNDIPVASNNFVQRCEKYRITSESVTVELVAPALSDQGTITSVQVPISYDNWCMPLCQEFYNTDLPQVADLGHALVQDPHPSATTPYTLFYRPRKFRFTDPNPREDQVVGWTRAYTGQARKGVYVPLRLNDFGYISAGKYMSTYTGSLMEHDGTETEMPVFDSPFYQQLYGYDTWFRAISATQFTMPHPSVSCISPNPGNVGFTWVKGTAATASIRVRVRMTLEFIVDNSSPYYPMVQEPVPPDHTALTMYREIAGRLKDAYPASYNDWAQLKSDIKKIAAAMLPIAKPALALASGILPYGGAVNKIGQALLDGASQWAADATLDPKTQAKVKQVENAAKRQLNRTMGQGRRSRRRRQPLAPRAPLPKPPNKPLPTPNPGGRRQRAYSR